MGHTGQSAQVRSFLIGRRARTLLALASTALILLLGLIQADQFQDLSRD
jgi:hypothetical protein